MEQPYFIPPGEGERLERGYRTGRVLAELPHLEAIELAFADGWEGVDPHTHVDHTDSFYVLEGNVEIFHEGEWRPAPVGTWVSIPPGVTHGFRSAGGPIRVLNVHAPDTGFVDGLR